ncbi:MAG TPA: lysine-2,3-aminomutase-like protein [Beijerinckiaceae bacterium]|nr:lysine-2,3-aminomutase-like protein [Beijerinckiaceae bacterium]
MSKTRIRDAAGLVAAGLVPAERRDEIARVAESYAVSITPTMAKLIQASDPHDPIALQFVPDAAELIRLPEELTDPIGDDAHSPVAGLIHRYPDRVLLKLLHACPVYCRFCFRRETVGPGGPNILSPEALTAALDYISGDRAIWEVILTGGDPLALAPNRLAAIMRALADIPHVRVVRIHTRVPLVDPARVTPELVEALRMETKPTWIALHANHAREFTPAGERAVALLIDAGFPMVSQTVLLRGVNDTVETLAGLMRRFVENRVKPYYLHHADLAPGTARFRTTLEAGQAIMHALRGAVSGLCQPTYVLDIPGGFGKSPIGPTYLSHQGGQISVRDFKDRSHSYLSEPPAQRKPDLND